MANGGEGRRKVAPGDLSAMDPEVAMVRRPASDSSTGHCLSRRGIDEGGPVAVLDRAPFDEPHSGFARTFRLRLAPEHLGREAGLDPKGHVSGRSRSGPGGDRVSLVL
jgi:hypothetical protein